MADLVFGGSSRKRSALGEWFDKLGGGTLTRAKPHVSETGHVLRSVGESVVVGGILGAVAGSSAHGLDMPMPASIAQHLPIKEVPIDGAVAAVGALAAIAMAHEPIAADLRNAAAAGASVFSYRKTKEFIEAKKASTVHGERFGKKMRPMMSAHGEEDPIVAAARAL